LNYWKKSTLNYNWYWFLTTFLGWTGLDMLYLRSPMMAIVKIVVNIFTLGYYWFYDAMEATFNKEQVQMAGPTMPFYGPLGVAAGMFMGRPGTDEDRSKHAYFLIYGVVLAFTGLFGGDSFLVGDNQSGYIRLISLCTIIFAPIAIFWWLYKLYLFFIRTDILLDTNWKWFGAPEPAIDSSCPNMLEVFTVWVLETFSVVLEYIPILGKVVPMLREVIKKLRIAYGMAVEVVEKGAQSVKVVNDAISQGSMTIEKTEAKEIVQGRTTGGGTESDVGKSTLFMLALGSVMVSGMGMTFWRTYQNAKRPATKQRNDKDGDVPPEPRNN
jgi:TM2 domain-containing membrane protein YozV